MMAKLNCTIITECWPLLVEEIEKLNRRAKRLGCTPLALTKSEPYMRERDGSVDDVIDVEVDGEPIKLNGWRFLARIEAVPGADNLIFTVPGEKAPDEYRTCSPYRCQHCNQDRLRKYTWIVEHDDGRHVQVGSSCMDDFLSAKNPERAVAWWMRSIDELTRYLEDLEAKTQQKSIHSGGLFINRPTLISAYDTLVTACQIVRERGGYEFGSDDGAPSTADRVRQMTSFNPLLEDITFADKVVEFVMARKDTADYFKNLSIMFTGGKVSIRNLRYICSAVYAYQKNNRAQGKNEFFGAVGDRLRDVKLTVTYVLPLESAYHETYDYLMIMRDADGRTFKWKKTSAGVVKEGDKILLTGTIKKHEEYKGVKQTVLNYCSIKKLEEAVA